jgi:hypothetical protein
MIMLIIGVVFYFTKAPRFIPLPIIQAKVFALFLLSVVLPILLFFLLKTTNRIKSIHLESVEERIIPIGIFILILILILFRVFPINELIEPYFFILGVFGSTLACLILAVLKFKVSIHMISVGAVLMFFIALSIHFHINIIGSIASMCVIAGLVATSRLHLKAHSMVELIIGFFIGVIPQIIVMNYWL